MQIDTGDLLQVLAEEYEKFLVYGPARESAKTSPQEGGQPPETSRQRFKAVRHKKRRSR